MRAEDVDFLIVGAAKSATTWLQKALQADPAVRMPDPELHFFSRRFDLGLDWYLAQFPPAAGAALVGEKSNSYMEAPAAAGRIAAALPRARLVAQLRDPVERAYSDYCMLYRRGEVGRDVARWLDPRVSATERFIAGGLYARQLEPFLDRFGRDRLFVALYEETVADPRGALGAVRAHLGLPREGPLPAAGRVKDRATPLAPPGLKRAFAPLLPLLAPYRDGALFRRVRALVASEVRYPPFPETLRPRLVEHYARENERLAAIMGRATPPWAAESRAA
jgi:hypothetical protein